MVQPLPEEQVDLVLVVLVRFDRCAAGPRDWYNVKSRRQGQHHLTVHDPGIYGGWGAARIAAIEHPMP